MPTTFKETRRVPTADKKDYIYYMVSEIELDNENKKMTASLTNNDERSFAFLKGKIETMYQVASLDQVTISFTTTLSKNKKCLSFGKDLVSALDFLQLHKAISEDLKNEITTHLNNLSNKTTLSTSLSERSES